MDAPSVRLFRADLGSLFQRLDITLMCQRVAAPAEWPGLDQREAPVMGDPTIF